MATTERYTYKQFLDYVNRGDMKWERKDPMQSEILKKVIPEDKQKAINWIKRKMCINTFKKNVNHLLNKGITKSQLEAPVLDKLLRAFQQYNPNIDGNNPVIVYSLLMTLNKDVANTYRETNEELFDSQPFHAMDIKDVLKEEKKKLISPVIIGKPPKEAKKELFIRARLGINKLLNQLEDNVRLLSDVKNEELLKSLDKREEIVKKIKNFPENFNKDKNIQLKQIGATKTEIGKQEFGLEKSDIEKINKIMNSDILDKNNVSLIKTTAKNLYKNLPDLKNTLDYQILENKILKEDISI